MIASLGMYDPRWLQHANDTLWSAIAARLRGMGLTGVPDRLTRDRPLAQIWAAPDLLLAQTCGYPLTTRLGEGVALVATPVYHAPGCDHAWHRSAVVVRIDEPAQDLAALIGQRVAINGRDSNTGMNLLRACVAPLARDGAFFRQVIETGAHARSVWAVIAGHADVAAIDAVTLALLHDRFPLLDRRIRVLDWTPASPGLPLITSARHPDATIAALRAALSEVMADPDLAGTRAMLRLAGVTVLARKDYETVLGFERDARTAGYPEIG